jgi:hypothetical protein
LLDCFDDLFGVEFVEVAVYMVHNLWTKSFFLRIPS